MTKHRNFLTGFLIFGIAFAMLITMCTPLDGTLDDIREKAQEANAPKENIPLVIVGTQNGTLTEGVAGSVTFSVTAANIADGSYTVTVANLPTGVSVQGQVTISNNSGTLTLAGNTSTVAGTTGNLILTIDEITSSEFTLTIKKVTIGAQNNGLPEKSSGTTTFPVTTANIANGQAGTITWYDNDGISVIAAPLGISASVTPVANNSAIVIVSATNEDLQGFYNFKVTIDGADSAMAILTVSPPFKMVTVGTQTGTMTAGVAGTVTFSVMTANIANGNYTATVANLPAGVTVSGQVAINNNSGTFTLAGTTSTVAGITTTLTLTIDSTTSSAFTLTIKKVTVSTQTGTMIAGSPGSVTFTVTTASIANGTYPAAVANLPGGLSVQGNSVAISNNSGTLTLTGTPAAAGTYSNLTLNIDDVNSAAFTLTIRGVTVGAQVGTLTAGITGTVTFPVTAVNIASGNYTVTAANLPTGVSVQGQVNINTSGSGTLTLAGNTSTAQGTATNLTLTIDGVTSPAFNLTITGVKTVTVGSQVGTLIAGATGTTVTFSVTTVNIASGNYDVSVGNLPNGVTVQGQVTITASGANGNGTLTLGGNASTVGGNTTNLTLTIDSTTSSVFTLNILSKTVTVGAQSGSLKAGATGTVTFPVTTTNIAANTYSVTVANLPAGMSVQGAVTINAAGGGTLTLAGNTSTLAGVTTTLTLSIDNATSAAFTLTIKNVTVGMQVGSLKAGTTGTVTFSVTTVNITNGNYTVSVANLPTGMSVQGQVNINNNGGTLTLTGNTSTLAGVTGNLMLTIDDITSGAFTLTIKNVTVGVQSGSLKAGTTGTVTFPVTTANIAAASYTVTVGNLPAGMSVQGQVTINTSGSGTLTLAGNTSTSAGVTSTLTLNIDGITSAAFTLTIKNVTVSAQSGTMTGGTSGNVTFPVTTSNIAAADYAVTVNNLPTGVSVSTVTINASGGGTLTLTGNTSTVAGTYSTLTLTIDGITSVAFTLTIGQPTLTGTVTIGGDNWTKGTLTTSVNTPGFTGAISYEWRQGSTGGTPLGTNSTYLLAAGDLNKDIYVIVSRAGAIGSISSSIRIEYAGISSQSELAAIASDGKYKLTQNFTISGNFNVIGSQGVAPFAGVFDGNGKTITFSNVNFVAYPQSTYEFYYYGLFDSIGSTGVVSNLKLAGSMSITNPSIKEVSSLYVGAVAGSNSGTIKNVTCQLTSISATGTGIVRVGGIVGNIGAGGTIRNCYTTGTIIAKNTIDSNTGNSGVICGGIAGYMSYNGTIEYCYSSATIESWSCTPTTDATAGGILGFAYLWSTYGTITVSGCVGMNPVLKSTRTFYSGGGTLGRIIGSSGGMTTDGSNFSYNYAKSDMQVLYEIGSFPTGGTTGDGLLTSSGYHTNKHGGDVTSANLQLQTWWQTSTVGPLWATSIWYDNDINNRDSKPWKWANNQPVLWFE